MEFVSGKRSYLCVLLMGVITQKPSSSAIFSSMEGGHMFIPADLCRHGFVFRPGTEHPMFDLLCVAWGREPFLPYSLVFSTNEIPQMTWPTSRCWSETLLPSKKPDISLSTVVTWKCLMIFSEVCSPSTGQLTHLLPGWCFGVSLRSKLLSAVFTEFTWANMCISSETYCDGWRWLYFIKVRSCKVCPDPCAKAEALVQIHYPSRNFCSWWDIWQCLEIFFFFGTTEEMLLTSSGNKPGLHVL